jgi:DNA (cytosine-5)-methyltransferase 1
MAMRLLDLFSGIGGFSYAAEKLIGGYETVAFCEMDEFCQKVLKKHWPQVPIFDDVRTIDATRLGRIDIVTGGYPCQPFSQAGRRQGEEDERHLWPEMLRIIKSCQPRYVLAENVAGHVTMGLDQVLTDLEDQGYTTRPIIVPACAKNAPHRRDRVWIIGQFVADTYKWQSRSGDESKSDETQQLKFSTDNTGERGIVADTERMGCTERAEKSEELNREKSSDKSDNGSQGCTISNTDKDVANTESINRNVNEIVREYGEAKTQEIPRNRDGISNTQGQTVPNTKSKRLQRRQFSSTISNQGNKKSNIRTRDSERSTSRSVEQQMGDMADGLSRGLLRHFDREPEHIPRVTKGEKDRAKKLKALGNSIVPQVAAEILLAIRVSEESV